MTLALDKVGAPMKTIKLLFAMNILGLLCFNMAAMQEKELNIPMQHPVPAYHHDENNEIFFDAVDHPVDGTVQIDPTNQLRTLKEQLIASRTRISRLASVFGLCDTRANQRAAKIDEVRLFPVVIAPSGTIAHPRIPHIHAILTNEQAAINQLIRLYEPQQNIQERTTEIRRISAQLEQAEGQLHTLLGQAAPLANQDHEQANAIDDTIDALRNHFSGYMRQGIVDAQYVPLENADRNLTREINAFFLCSKNRLAEVRRSIDTTLHEIQTIEVEVQTTRQVLENIVRTETAEPITTPVNQPGIVQSVASKAWTIGSGITYAFGTATHVFGTAWSHRQEVAGLFTEEGRKKAQEATVRAATSLIQNRLAQNRPALADPAVQNRVQADAIPQELTHIQETLGQSITHMNGALERLRTAIATEEEIKANVGVLCSVLDNRDNPNFQLHNQEKVESSLATDILKSNLWALAMRQLLAFRPALNRPLPDIPVPMIGNIPLPSTEAFLMRLFPDAARTAFDQSEQQQAIDADNIQPHRQPQTFDDRYTGWLINTQNPNYLLYDIAARTRFNTGRFSYLIRPFVHAAEEGFGQLPRSEKEQPGDRSREIMRALADESTPLEHPWLLFFKPAPFVVRGIENVLRTADPTLPQQTQRLADAHGADTPFTSTSPQSFIWNGLKKLVRWPAQQVAPLVISALSTCGNGIKRGAEIMAGPFVHMGPIVELRKTMITVKDLISRKFQAAAVATAKTIRTGLTLITNEHTIPNLERNIREGHPASESITMIQDAVANHELEGLTRPLIAAIAHNHQRIRALAQKYQNIQRIDPIIPLDPVTRQPINQQATIRDARLRTDLGSFAEGWGRR